MRVLLAGLLIGCATPREEAPPDADLGFELRVRFSPEDGTAVVNGEPVVDQLVVTAPSYEDAQRDIVLDVAMTTASGAITKELRPGFCATNPAVDLARLGPVKLESLLYRVNELPPPRLYVWAWSCVGTREGAAGGP